VLCPGILKPFSSDLRKNISAASVQNFTQRSIAVWQIEERRNLSVSILVIVKA
jgi:hypothetical protein